MNITWPRSSPSAGQPTASSAARGEAKLAWRSSGGEDEVVAEDAAHERVDRTEVVDREAAHVVLHLDPDLDRHVVTVGDGPVANRGEAVDQAVAGADRVDGEQVVDAEAVLVEVDVDLEGAHSLDAELDVERRLRVGVARVEGDERLHVVAVVGAARLRLVEADRAVLRIAVGRVAGEVPVAVVG
ncbi:MAG: hypothetical protein IPK07_28035 [Deltaproteobacteria bacterium]|nr:hypothetical protein [Deltaproteobacteria bacterium]